MATIISREDADKMTVYAVGANYLSNEYVVDGGKGGIALNNIASGSDGVIQARCVVSGFKKAAGVAWVEGTTYLYFDQVAKAFTTVVQADGLYRGRAYADALLAAVVGDVEIIEPISDGEGKMDLAVPTAATNVATLNALGQVTDSTVLLATLTAKMAKAVPTAATNVATLDAVGQVTDSTVLLSTLTAKMAKAVPTAATNVATLDAVGQVTDSTVLLSTLTAKQNLAVPTAAANVATLDALGQVTDSTVALSTLTAKQNLAVPTAAANLATLDALGQVTDSTIAAASIAGAVTVGGIYNDNMGNSTNVAQSLADATAEVIDLEDVDLVGDITYAAGTTSLATIPANGMYVIYYALLFAAGAGTYNKAMIYVNGSSVAETSSTPDNANPISATGFTVQYLSAAETVGLYGKQDSGGALNVTAGILRIQRIQ